MTLASVTSYASLMIDMMSEASLLVVWGGVLLIVARRAHASRAERQSEIVTVAQHSIRGASDLRVGAGA
jgi:hypothetical protein